jgi:hypothetical protein
LLTVTHNDIMVLVLVFLVKLPHSISITPFFNFPPNIFLDLTYAFPIEVYTSLKYSSIISFLLEVSVEQGTLLQASSK